MYVVNAFNSSGDLVQTETAFTLSGAYLHADDMTAFNVEIYLNGVLISQIEPNGNAWGYGR